MQRLGRNEKTACQNMTNSYLSSTIYEIVKMRFLTILAVMLFIGFFQSQPLLALHHHDGMHASPATNHNKILQAHTRQVKIEQGKEPARIAVDSGISVSGDVNCPSHSDKMQDCCESVCHSSAALFITSPYLPEVHSKPVKPSYLITLEGLPTYRFERPPRS
jgi:hypothetical protein